jgi:ArsR family transcriptional regulator
MYYTFRILNMKMSDAPQQISGLLRAIDHPARLQILLAIGEDEACVCHLEALFGWRQAYISQHLMAMRRAGVLKSRRQGKFVYYRLADPRMLELIHLAATVAGVALDGVNTLASSSIDLCKCPRCRVEEETPAISFTL